MVRLLLASSVVFAQVALAAPPVLRWGCDAQGGAPYVFQDPREPTRLVGFEVEVAQAVAQQLGTTARPVHGPWATLIELLKRGDFDVALNGIEVTDDKKHEVRLSRPYFAAAEVLTIRAGDAAAPRTLQALTGRRVGTLPGSLAERLAKSAGADVRTYEGGQDEVYDDLKLGRTDAVLLDAPIARFYADIDPAFETLPTSLGTVTYAMALRPEDVERATAIDAAIDALSRDGTLERIYRTWGVWNAETARLFGVDVGSTSHSPEFERWRSAVGVLPPFVERLRDRYPSFIPVLAQGAGLTLLVSMCAMALAMVLGLLIASARRFGPWPLRALATAYVELFRGTPLLIQLVTLYFGLPEIGVTLDPFIAGVTALGLNYAAAEAENYRAGLSSVPSGQLEAAAVLGLGRWATLRHVLVPQALRVSLPPMTNDFIALLKDSSLVSVVTLTE
ncbi:MAG: ABC transporter permease subunit, partial [Archangium sp.]|nr:ABC transporter permease subunit [Archangium sp.]